MPIMFKNTMKLIGIETRADAEKILYDVDELMRVYAAVTVGDIKSLAGLKHTDNDNTLGWADSRRIHECRIIKEGVQYTIEFPTPVLLYSRDADNTPAKTSDRTYPVKKATDDYIDPIHITIHTNLVDSPEEVIAEVFKYVYTIKDRTVNVSIQ